ncbi:putative ell-associated factor protein [Erysiphe neolycopersici]|uniref:Putative ell-associated factor protein n=1 Tax=Erysiphe neolycopersici TaxID=212602 RepID=A0A420HVC5_9PEZI|nr:putative ell-associated factor protein [Erysiphe neolycopersici]
MDIGFGNYPIVLSDALLGKATKEVYTGIRYKNKANDAMYPSSNSCRLQPDEEDPASFNLSYLNNPEKSSYHGKRAVDENQFVLIFDAAKEHFVLHRLDSNFDMMTTSPSTDSHGINLKNQTTTRQKRITKDVSKTIDSNKEVSRRKVEKPKTTKKPIREPISEEESDDGLTIEYPGGQMQNQPKVYSSPIPTYHRELRESCEREEDILPDDDGFAEQNFETSRHSSPLRPPAAMSDEDIEMALEAELEQELLKESAGQTYDDNESDESEEE